MCIAAGLISLLIRQIDWAKFLQVIAQHGLTSYIWLVIIAGLGWCIYVWRWRLLLLPLCLTPSFCELFVDSLIGLFYGLFVPTGLAGDAVRAIRVGNRHQATRKTFISVILDRLIGLFAVALLFGIQLVRNGLTWRGIRLSWVGWFFFATLTLIVVLLVWGESLLSWLPVAIGGQKRWRDSLERWPLNWLVRQAERLWSLAREYADARQFVALGVLASIIYQLLVTLVYYVGGRALGIQVGFGDYVWIVALVTLSQILPITIAGLGVREGLFVFLLGQYDVSASTAVALSLIVFSVTLLFGLLGGGLGLAEGVRAGHSEVDGR